MRVSIFIGLPIFALGIVLSYLAGALIVTQTVTPLQTTANLFATAIFILFSASMLGIGIGLVVHWIIGFASHMKAFVAELVLSFAAFFVGIGATIMSANFWSGLQLFFAFFTASMTLFSLSFINLFGGIAHGLFAVKKYVKKKFKK